MGGGLSTRTFAPEGAILWTESDVGDASKQGGLARSRLIKRSELIPCREAFIDCKVPGSELKENYSIIGAGVTQSSAQFVNLDEPHGLALGVAAMPHGVTNNLHIHYTAEVFMVFRGEWLFRWGAEGADGELVGRAGDVLSMPTWVFRGFTNIGPDDSWIFTVLGRDDSGGVVWHPKILADAAEHGLYLRRDNMMIDTSTGAPKPPPEDLMTPLTSSFIASLKTYSVEDMRRRVVTSEELVWSTRALLDSALPGHSAELAPVIGPGMTQDREASPKITNPHGFSVEWLRISPGQTVGPYRVEPKQVLILQKGRLEITLEVDGERSTVVAEPWETFSAPSSVWRTFRSIGDEPVLMTLTTSSDGRTLIEWSPQVVEAAWVAGLGVDPNGYLAPAAVLPDRKRCPTPTAGQA